MATNTIKYAGNVLACTVERFPGIKKAQRKFRQYNIPGRNGDVFFQDDAYENVIQSYQVYAGDDTDGQAQADWTTLAAQLYKDGYQVLEDSYDTDHFRKAVFNGPIDVENSWNTHGRATLEFNCRPERFLKNGQTAQSFAAATNSYQVWDFNELSNYIKTTLRSYGVTGGIVYTVTVPANTARMDFLNKVNDGSSKILMNIAVGTETTAASAITQQFSYTFVNSPTGASARDFILPAVWFDGIPQVLLNKYTDPTMLDGYAGAVQNDYMPAHPTIVLHDVASHSVEVLAAQVNGYGIYVKQYVSGAWYFIDTENWNVTMATSQNGDRYATNNVRVDAGLILSPGENPIYTSTYYDMTITPNLWEL